jgi:carbon monoxide dehydrogenase subunit G
MKFTQSATIAAPIEQVWDFLMDIPRVAKCVPGVDSVEPQADDRYRGTIRVAIGPIRLALHGDVWIIEQDVAARRAAMRAEAADRQAGGSVKAVLGLALTEKPGEGTELVMETDAQILGRIGEFGQPVIRKKADQIVGEFAKNLQREITASSG